MAGGKTRRIYATNVGRRENERAPSLRGGCVGHPTEISKNSRGVNRNFENVSRVPPAKYTHSPGNMKKDARTQNSPRELGVCSILLAYAIFKPIANVSSSPLNQGCFSWLSRDNPQLLQILCAVGRMLFKGSRKNRFFGQRIA